MRSALAQGFPLPAGEGQGEGRRLTSRRPPVPCDLHVAVLGSSSPPRRRGPSARGPRGRRRAAPPRRPLRRVPGRRRRSGDRARRFQPQPAVEGRALAFRRLRQGRPLPRVPRPPDAGPGFRRVRRGSTHDPPIRRRDRHGRAGFRRPALRRQPRSSRSPLTSEPRQLDQPRGASPCGARPAPVRRNLVKSEEESSPWRKRHCDFWHRARRPVAVDRSRLPRRWRSARRASSRDGSSGPTERRSRRFSSSCATTSPDSRPTPRRAATAPSASSTFRSIPTSCTSKSRGSRRSTRPWTSAPRFPATSRSSSTCRP